MAKKYFNGAHCNTDWGELESEAAKRERGRGWYTFCKTVRAERGNRCEICGIEALSAEAERSSRVENGNGESCTFTTNEN